MGALSDPSGAIVEAVRRLLRADAAVTALVGVRINDKHPSSYLPGSTEYKNAFPYIELGEIQCVDDGSACGEGDVEAFLTLRCWSRPVRDGIPVGKTRAMEIASAVKAALHDRQDDLFDTPEFGCSALHVENVDTRTEGDGQTTQAILTVRALIQPR
jgi:hypothetical protein